MTPVVFVTRACHIRISSLIFACISALRASPFPDGLARQNHPSPELTWLCLWHIAPGTMDAPDRTYDGICVLGPWISVDTKYGIGSVAPTAVPRQLNRPARPDRLSSYPRRKTRVPDR
ncbi:hypothetical protein JB92DRAFT_2097094 [Gautieria morchelliformis]|nr:hypothetical protein JB92DRAFT_2097094 [Gautieria morchelliformis]